MKGARCSLDRQSSVLEGALGHSWRLLAARERSWRPPGQLGTFPQASKTLSIDKDNGWEVSRTLRSPGRHWRWIQKASGLEASRTLRDDLEGLKHYACSGFKVSRRPDGPERCLG